MILGIKNRHVDAEHIFSHFVCLPEGKIRYKSSHQNFITFCVGGKTELNAKCYNFFVGMNRQNNEQSGDIIKVLLQNTSLLTVSASPKRYFAGKIINKIL